MVVDGKTKHAIRIERESEWGHDTTLLKEIYDNISCYHSQGEASEKRQEEDHSLKSKVDQILGEDDV